MAALFLSCNAEENKKPNAESDTPVKTPVSAPSFDADSAYAYVAQQVAFGPRVPNTPEHAACASWLASELERHGAEVTVQEGRVRAFDGTILNMKNIVGTFHPESRDRILLFAHWDTRPFADKDTVRLREPIDGANDGASGVGVLLEIARQLGLGSADVGVDIVFFDAEDYGRPDWLPAADLGFGDRFDPSPTPPTVDDNLFVSELAGIPSANIVDYRTQVQPMGYGPFHHTHADNMDVIDRETLAQVGATVLSVVRQP